MLVLLTANALVRTGLLYGAAVVFTVTACDRAVVQSASVKLTCSFCCVLLGTSANVSTPFANATVVPLVKIAEPVPF